MKALPVKFYDKKTGMKVQAFEVDFCLCFDPQNKDVECAFYYEAMEHPCYHCKVLQSCGLTLDASVIFLEIKE